MTRLTIEEYKRGHDDGRWPETIANRPDALAAFMVEFANPRFLSGPFGGSFGLVTIRDARKGPNKLYTETETYNRTRAHIANNAYYMPRLANGASSVETTHEYISGWHDKETLEPIAERRRNGVFFMTRNTLPGSATLDHPHLATTTNSSFEIDGLDMLRMFKQMVQKMSAEEIVRRISAAEAKIEQSIRNYLEHEADATPTYERPILLTLHGNDDSSWGKAFPTLEKALEYADELEGMAATMTRPPMTFTN